MSHPERGVNRGQLGPSRSGVRRFPLRSGNRRRGRDAHLFVHTLSCRGCFCKKCGRHWRTEIAKATKRHADEPAYEIPLGKIEMIALAHVFIAWGQIDFTMVV